MERRSAHRQYRCEATLPDGTAAVLFASTDSPAKALAMVRPVTIRVFRGGKTKAVGRSVAKWKV